MLNPVDLWLAGIVAEARRVELMRSAARQIVAMDAVAGYAGMGRSLRRSIGQRLIHAGLVIAGSSQSTASAADACTHRSLTA